MENFSNYGIYEINNFIDSVIFLRSHYLIRKFYWNSLVCLFIFLGKYCGLILNHFRLRVWVEIFYTYVNLVTMQYFGDLHDLIMTVVISTITRATRDGFEIMYLVEVCNLTRNTWYPNPAYVPITMEEVEYVGGWNRWTYLMVWNLI